MSKQHFDVYVSDDGPEDAKILFVGEAPGEQEHEQRKPFVGQSGDILTKALAMLGVERGEVRLANLCHYRPFNNKFDNLIGTEVLRDGVKELYAYIERVKPVVIVPLGNHPLAFLTGKKGIGKWRGSILSYINDDSIKVIPTYHPAAVLRDRGLYPTFKLDLRRILADSDFRDKRLPERTIIVDPRGLDLEEWTERLCNARTLACDIETVKKTTIILCVGFAISPQLGVCIVPAHADGRRAIERILVANNRKIFQFGSFDTRQLAINGYQINDASREEFDRLYYWDTLIAQHVLAPELPRSLEYLTSILTREPYYKTEGRGNIPGDTKSWGLKTNKDALYVYNGKDCCTTFEAYEQQVDEILGDEDYRRTFDYEMSLLEVADDMAAAGMFIDQSRRAMLEEVLLTKWAKKQFALDGLTGFETNVRSPKLKNILYDKDKMGLPTRRNRDGGITTDEDAIVSLIAYCQDRMDSVVRADTIFDWRVKLTICKTILEIRGIRQLLSNYILEKMKDGTYRATADGRIHSMYKVGGTETGRSSSSKYVDGTGFNAQTLPRDPIEVPDEIVAAVELASLKSEVEKDSSDDDEDMEEAA